MDKRTESQARWMGRYYGQLQGATIEKVTIAVDEDPDFGTDIYPMLTVKFKDGQTAEILVFRDEEGNGPGFLQGLPTPRTIGQGVSGLLKDPRLAALDAEATDTKDGTWVLVVAAGEKELIQVGEDPANPDQYVISLLDARTADPVPAFQLDNLDVEEMIARVEGIVNGKEGVRAELMLEHAENVLKDHHGTRWHSGGGIWLIAAFGKNHRLTAAPDEEGAATYGIEVTNEETGDVIAGASGLTSSEMETAWISFYEQHIG